MATNISTIRPLIQAALLTKADRVFYEKTQGNPTFPYIVYSLNSYSYQEVTDQVELEVNAYGRGMDTSALETLADNVWDLFNHYYHIDNNIEFAAYPSVRNNIDTGDPEIRQRRLLFTLRICN